MQRIARANCQSFNTTNAEAPAFGPRCSHGHASVLALSLHTPVATVRTVIRRRAKSAAGETMSTNNKKTAMTKAAVGPKPTKGAGPSTQRRGLALSPEDLAGVAGGLG